MKSRSDAIAPQYPRAANFDDQTVGKNDILFDIFLLGDCFTHRELSEKSPTVNVGNQRFEVHDGILLRNGAPWDRKSVADGGAIRDADEEIVIYPHFELKTFTTTLPRRNFTISQSSASAITVANDATAVIATTYDPERKTYAYSLRLEANGTPVYWNGRKTERLETSYDIADRLIIGGVAIERRQRQLKITPIGGTCRLDPRTLIVQDFRPEYPEDFPEYRRSPRIILQQPTEKIKIAGPDPAPQNSKNDIVRTILPPITMLAGGFAMVMISGGNPLMMLGMAGASLGTAAMSVSSYFNNKKEHRHGVKEREETYRQLLVRRTAELSRQAERQRDSLEFHYPDVHTLTHMVTEYHPRIYERNTNNADFLNISLGTGTVPASYAIDFDDDSQNQDPLLEEAREIVSAFRTLGRAPVTATLRGQALGLVGTYPVLKTVLSSILFQTAAFHSYRDVECIILVPEESYEHDWKKWRWLPHLRVSSINMRGIVHDAQSRDLILNSFYQLITKRRQALREAGQEKIAFAPHYLLAVLDDSYLAGHGLNEYLAEDMNQYGVTVIWGKESQAMLPETVTTLIHYSSSEAGELVNENRTYVSKEFTPMRLPEPATLETAIRRLANLRHVEAEKNAIPAAVTFLEMYGVKKIAQLDVRQRWATADTSKTLAVPLGLRGKDDLVFLNLHERAHGPHGLVAGTTGSGKSEILQSYVLSLAINFAPEDVGFLPIDFKGGGMANEFKNLPHLLGAITNLDGAASARALASIRAELQKRQRLFGQFAVNHINGYTKLYKEGKAAGADDRGWYPHEPLPHLFLISDEFAELKANEPEFMAELVSTARIGRSLGVHLILATQKPSGVVDDQIWSNSRFKLALKVQDESDSNEILKTPDAASIVEPGRAYLQVGNNEIYELFQSAWSGAAYTPDATREKKADERIWRINAMGQYELLTRDLSEGEDTGTAATEEPVTQLAGIVDHIAQTVRETGAVLPQKPWLPPLPDRLVTPETDREEAWRQPRDLSVPLGLLDIPSRQAQETLDFNLSRFGHTAVHGSAGYGKSTLLQTLVMNLARKNNPGQVRFNLLDFGTNGLLPLRSLPHVADIARLEEPEKLLKFLKRIRSDVDGRKELFAQHGVASLTQYESKTGERLPVCVTVVDGYDPVREHGLQEQVEGAVNQVLRDGASIGMYAVMTGLRSDTFKIGMLSNIPTRIALFLVEDNANRDVMGRDALAAEEIVGRGQVKTDEPRVVQFYLPAEADNDIARLQALDKEITDMDRQWDGDRPAPIPMLPKALSWESFFADKGVRGFIEEGKIPLGLSIETTEAVGFDPARDRYFLIVDDMLGQTDSVERAILEAVRSFEGRYERIVFDSNERFAGMGHVFDTIVPEADYATFVTDIMAEFRQREDGSVRSAPLLIYIPDSFSFLTHCSLALNDFKKLLKDSGSRGIYFIFQGDKRKLEGLYDDLSKQLCSYPPAGMVGSRLGEQQYVRVKSNYNEPALNDDEHNFFSGGSAGRVKLASG